MWPQKLPEPILQLVHFQLCLLSLLLQGGPLAVSLLRSGLLVRVVHSQQLQLAILLAVPSLLPFAVASFPARSGFDRLSRVLKTHPMRAFVQLSHAELC